MNDRTAEEPQDVIARSTPEERKVLDAYRSAVARKAGRAGRGAAKARTKEQCQKAQRAAMASRMARKRSRMAQDAPEAQNEAWGHKNTTEPKL